MKKVNLIAASFLMVALFSGCATTPIESVKNGDFTVEFLFEQNGCRMYRFKDCGNYIYWSDCQGNVQSQLEHSHFNSITTDKSK